MYSRKVGKLLVFQIVGFFGKFIGIITQENPIKIKIVERGILSNLKEGDLIIDEEDSVAIQEGDKEGEMVIRKYFEAGVPLKSGLASLGVTDGVIHQILPTD